MPRTAASTTKPKADEPAAEPAPETDLTAAAAEIFKDDITRIDGVYVDAEGKPLPLFQRLVKIMADLPNVDPAGENKHFNYKFLTTTQITGLLRPRLAAQKILIWPEIVEELDPVNLTTQKGGHSLLTRMNVTFRVIDAIDGNSFTGQVEGYGDDPTDKGANKAYTAALKNFLVKLFLIGGESDLEDDAEADRRASSRSSGSERVQTVEVGDAPEITGIRRGGRSDVATDAQVARVGQYIRDLQLEAPAFAQFVDKILGDSLVFGDDPWMDVKSYLEGLSGADIGKLVTAFEEVMNRAADSDAADAQARDQEPK